uniref:protein-tyrosine-phosphatase n=1 Tax=Heterorhabditis bacteriophora TaxID=37862 RepID=A0A1I7WRS0_HETBA
MSITHVKIQNNGVLLDLFGGESFASLSELVQYYMDNPEQLQEKNGGTIIMRRPISIPLHEPAAQEARAPSSQRWFHANITGGEAVQLLAKEKQWTFLVRESQRAPGSYAITVKTTDDHVVHILIQKNTETGMFHVGGGDEFRTVSDLLAHYNNNPMVEEGSQRVVHLINVHIVILKDVGSMESDYINANYIKIPEGPPLHLQADREYISTQGCLPHTVIDFWRMVWQENSRVIVMTTKELERTRFVGWPDHGCPEHPEAVLKFLDAVDEACKRAIATQGPVVVHCSAGIGRTGTFIVIDVLLNQIRHRGGSCPIDIPRTVMCIREQRSGMVQTEAQYGFLYKAISCYIASTCKTRHSSAEENLTLPTHLPPPPLPRRSKPVPDQAKAYVNNT